VKRGIALDAGPLLLLSTGVDLAGHFKRTSTYGEAGYRALADFLSSFDVLVVTPHVLTEAWNMTGNDGNQDQASRAMKARLLSIMSGAYEAFNEARTLLTSPDFHYLGLADTALLEAAYKQQCPVITQDAAVYAAGFRRSLSMFLLSEIIAASPYARR
jgi:hypothetical protein